MFVSREILEVNFSCLLLFRYGISGFPTLKFFPKGNKEGEDYEGGRDLEDFVSFINEKCGTKRDANGQYTSEVSELLWVIMRLYMWL